MRARLIPHASPKRLRTTKIRRGSKSARDELRKVPIARPDPVRRRDDAIHGHVVRFCRQFLNDLTVKPKRPATGVAPEPRQEPVIMTGAPTQAVAMEVKRETRHKHPIDVLGFDGETVGPRFRDL